MVATVNTNIPALYAQRNMGANQAMQDTAMQRLSTGLRINSAKDDAAGLAVRELMRAEIAVIKQGARNAQDGISMLQTMEGAMASIDQLLIRMKELAEQAATGSYSLNQRNIMNNEFRQMIAEIDRIATTTTFNSINMLNSATGYSTIHFGTGSQIQVNSVDVTASALGIASASLSGGDGTNAISALTLVTGAIEIKDSARASLGYMMNRLESTTAVLNIQAENLMASESRISDVDVATEMAMLTRNQVLAQAGIAMLSQANSMPRMALDLLRS